MVEWSMAQQKDLKMHKGHRSIASSLGSSLVTKVNLRVSEACPASERLPRVKHGSATFQTEGQRCHAGRVVQSPQIRAKFATLRYAGNLSGLGWLRLGTLENRYGVSPGETPGQPHSLHLITHCNQMCTQSNIFQFVMT